MGGILWNALVIGIILKKKLFTQPSVMLMLNLAIANLLVCLLIMPFPVIFGILVVSGQFESIGETESTVADGFCQTGILLGLLPSLSFYTISLMTMDRVIYLRKPLTYVHIVTPRRMFCAIGALWLFCLITSLPPLFYRGGVVYSRDGVTCYFGVSIIRWYPIFLTLLLIVVNALELIGWGYIVYITRKFSKNKLHRITVAIGSFSNRSRRDLCSHEQAKRREKAKKMYNRQQLHLTKAIGVLFSANMINYVPVLIYFFVLRFTATGTTPTTFTLGYIIYISRAFIHPIVQSYLTRDIRHAVSKFCTTHVLDRCRRKKNTHNRGQATTRIHLTSGSSDGQLQVRGNTSETSSGPPHAEAGSVPALSASAGDGPVTQGTSGVLQVHEEAQTVSETGDTELQVLACRGEEHS